MKNESKFTRKRTKKVEPNLLICVDCGSQFNSKTELAEHCAVPHIRCIICGDVFKESMTLKHMSSENHIKALSRKNGMFCILLP